MAADSDDGALRRAVDRLPSMISCWNADLRNTYANAVHTEYFGRDPDELDGVHLRDMLGPTVFDWVRPHVRGVLGGEVQHFEGTLVDVHGTRRTTQVTYVPDLRDGDVAGFTVLAVDVTARATAERQRDDAVRMFRIAMENAPIGKAVLTVGGRWLQVNRALCELTGYSSTELQAKSFRDITHPDDLAAADAHLEALIDGSELQVASEKRYIRKDGTVIWVQRNATIVRDTGHGDDVVIVQIQDITARKTAERRLARQTVTDDLTGLGNRRGLTTELAALEDVSPGVSIGVLFIDVDRFKSINDEFGHAVGDLVLAEVARRVRANIRGSDVACRVGGDEFVVLVLSTRSPADVTTLAERLRRSLSGTYRFAAATVTVGVSVGSSWSRDLDLDRLLADADHAMYQRKRLR